MIDRSNVTDPLLAAILEEADKVRREDLKPNPDDPALRELVERAVAPVAHALTPEGLDQARKVATLALATHPDIEPVLERVRQQQKAGSNLRAARSATSPDELQRRRNGRRRPR